MPSFSQRLSRGLGNLSAGIKGTMIPLLIQMENFRREDETKQESADIRKAYLKIAADEAARSEEKFSMEQTEFQQEQALLKAPARTMVDFEKQQAMGFQMATPISRIMELVEMEKANAAKRERDVREQEAEISGKQALATQRLSGGGNAEQDVLKAVAEKAGTSYLKSREKEDPVTGEMITPPLVGPGHNAPDTLTSIISQIMGGQGQPAQAGQPQSGVDYGALRAKSETRQKAIEIAQQDPKFRGMTPEEQEEFLQWLEANKLR